MKISKIFYYFAVAYYLLVGITIVITPFPLNTSTLFVLNTLFEDFHIGGMLLIVSSMIFLCGLLIEKNPFKSVFYFMPMLFFSWLFGLTAFNVVLHGKFADGVVRSWQFIFTDQLWTLLVMIVLTIVVFEPIWHKKSYE